MGDFKTTLSASVAATAVTAVLASTPASANIVAGSAFAVPTTVAMNAAPPPPSGGSRRDLRRAVTARF